MSDDETHDAGTGDAHKTGKHETVVQYEFADPCRTGAIETDAGQIGRIGRKEEITVAGRNERHHHHRIHTHSECHGHDDGHSGTLGVNQFRSEK